MSAAAEILRPKILEQAIDAAEPGEWDGKIGFMNDNDETRVESPRGVGHMVRALRWRPVNHSQVWVAAVTGWLIVVVANAAIGRPFLASWPGAAVMLLIGLSESYYLRRTRPAQATADR